MKDAQRMRDIAARLTTRRDDAVAVAADAEFPSAQRAAARLDAIRCQTAINALAEAEDVRYDLADGFIPPQEVAAAHALVEDATRAAADIVRTAVFGAGHKIVSNVGNGPMMAPLDAGGGSGRHGEDDPFRLPAMQRAERDLAYADLYRHDPQKGDGVMADILREQGRDGPPQLVSKAELDQAVKSGETELWRGFANPDHAAQFMTGPLYVGRGNIGSGMYTSAGNGRGYTGRAKAEAYAGPRGTILRMSLKASARTISIGDLRKMQEADLARMPHLSASTLNVLLDTGRYAALKGFDAVLDPTFDEALIISRDALRVQKEPA